MIGLVTLTRALRPAARRPWASDANVRLLAAGAACASALVAEALLGASGLSVGQMLLALVSVALWALLVAIGFRIGVLAIFAVPALYVFLVYEVSATLAAARNALGALGGPSSDTRLFIAGFIVVAAVPLSMVVLSMATRAGRRLRGVLFAAGLAATVALVWSVPLLVAVAAAPSSQWILLGAAALALPSLVLAPILSRLEASRGMRAALMLDARDSLMRVSGGAAGVLAALWAASMAGSHLSAQLAGTPLEGLALPAGWCAGAVVLAVILWGLWRAPRALYRGQLQGRFYPRAISDAIWFLLLASATGVFIDVAIRGSILGWTSWIALASAAGYGAIRVGTSAPAVPATNPLWIVVLEPPPWAGRAVVNRLASAWKIGPVNIVATPEAAPAIAGPHLRASAASRRLHHLFPLRPSHLIDWDDNLPPPAAWNTLPVRELYARAELWPETLGARLASHSTVIAIGRWRPTIEEIAAGTVEAAGERGSGPKAMWRALLGVRGMRGRMVRPSDAPRLRPTSTGEEGDTPATGHSYETLLSHVEMLQADLATASRHILLLHHHQDRDTAESICEAVAGRLDRVDLTIHPWLLPINSRTWLEPALWTIPLGFWSQAFRLAGRVLARPGHDIGWFVRLWSVPLRALATRAMGTYDLAVLEPQGAAPSKNSALLDFFSLVVAHRAVEQVIALRSIGRDEDVTPMFDTERYTGEIRWSPGLTPRARGEEIARRLLEMSSGEVEAAERPPASPTAAAQPAGGTSIAAEGPSTAAREASDVEAEDVLDVYITLTADVALFREPLMDAFDQRRDMRRSISVIAEQQWFDIPLAAVNAYDESGFAAGTSSSAAEEAQSRFAHADVYVLVLGPSRWNLVQGEPALRGHLAEARRRGLPCLVFQRRSEDPETETEIYAPSADVAARAEAFLAEVHGAYSVATFSDYRELLSLVFTAIEQTRPELALRAGSAVGKASAAAPAETGAPAARGLLRLYFCYEMRYYAEAQELLRELRQRFHVDEDGSSRLDEARIEQSDAVVLLTSGYWSDPARLEAQSRTARSFGKPAIAVAISQPATPPPPWIRNANDHWGSRAYLRTPGDSALGYAQRRRAVQQITQNLWHILHELGVGRQTTGGSTPPRSGLVRPGDDDSGSS